MPSDESRLILGLTPRQFLTGVFIGNVIGLLLQVALVIYMSVH